MHSDMITLASKINVVNINMSNPILCIQVPRVSTTEQASIKKMEMLMYLILVIVNTVKQANSLVSS